MLLLLPLAVLCVTQASPGIVEDPPGFYKICSVFSLSRKVTLPLDHRAGHWFPTTSFRMCISTRASVLIANPNCKHSFGEITGHKNTSKILVLNRCVWQCKDMQHNVADSRQAALYSLGTGSSLRKQGLATSEFTLHESSYTHLELRKGRRHNPCY